MTKQEFMAMSLPYGLKIIDRENDIEEVSAIGENTFQIEGGSFAFGWYADIDEAKLILHPLSDLTKEIEHDGEKFVPIEKLNELLGYEETKLVHYIGSGVGWLIKNSSSDTAISFLRIYNPIQKLVEWHFDIAGLIDKGEAIDINTIEGFSY